MSLAESAVLQEVDFVMPLKRVGLLTRAVLEAIRQLYRPRRIVVVAPQAEARLLDLLAGMWDIGPLFTMAEEEFFHPIATLDEILAEYGEGGHAPREVGWWVQQLIKLGAATQVPGLSQAYVCWDADLVPVRRWPLCSRNADGTIHHYFAILQSEARSEYNAIQYAECMHALCGFRPEAPDGGGTFVSHHMWFHASVVNALLRHIEHHNSSALPWPLLIMSFSRRFDRFSEYMTYAAFALIQQRNGSCDSPLEYHKFNAFGNDGIRFRNADVVIREIVESCGVLDGGLPYDRVRDYARMKWPGDRCNGPGYIQLDRVYGLNVPPGKHPYEC